MKYLSIVVMALLVLQGCFRNEETNEPAAAKPSSAKKDRPSRVVPLAPSETATAIGITAENYPFIDGSTSTLPLVQGLYWRMFQRLDDKNTWTEEQHWGWLGYPEKAAQTVESYEMLIAGDVDVIFVPDPSEVVKRKAADAGVELEYIRIGTEALIFVTPPDNPVNAITIEQVVKIYADMTITSWADLGGKDGPIIPLCRNPDSGSHAQMENLVLRGKALHPEIEKNYSIRGMLDMLEVIDMYKRMGRKYHENNAFPLGYTLFYYVHQMQATGVRSVMVGSQKPEPLKIKPLAVGGVVPTVETILSKEYPLSMSYFAVVRKDEPADSPARKLIHWLLTDEGQWLVMEAGLGALRPVEYKPPVQTP